MIDIVFNKKEFEYDAYTLIKAFYPQEEVSILYEGEEKEQRNQEIESARDTCLSGISDLSDEYEKIKFDIL